MVVKGTELLHPVKRQTLTRGVGLLHPLDRQTLTGDSRMLLDLLVHLSELIPDLVSNTVERVLLQYVSKDLRFAKDSAECVVGGTLFAEHDGLTDCQGLVI